MPLVTVIMPFNKGKDYLNDALHSLTLQNIEDFQLLLILNGVTEDISDIISFYGDKLNLIIENIDHTVTPTYSRNMGIKIAKTKYIYFLDSDDWLDKFALDKLIFFAKKNPNYKIISGKRIYTKYNPKTINNSKEFREIIQNSNVNIKKTNNISLIIPNEDGFENISSLHSLFDREFLLDNNILFNTDLNVFGDYPFVFKLLNCISNQETISNLKNNEFIVNSYDSFYFKRNHDDPVNLPSLEQLFDDKSYFLETINVYSYLINSILKNTNFNDYLRVLLDKKFINFYFIFYSKKIIQNQDNKWRKEYLKIISEVIKNINNKSIKFSQQIEIYAVKSINLKLLKVLINIRLTIKKIPEIIRKPYILPLMIYVTVFNKLKIKENMIIFESFRGKSYSDSGKYIYEYLYNYSKENNDFKSNSFKINNSKKNNSKKNNFKKNNFKKNISKNSNSKEKNFDFVWILDKKSRKNVLGNPRFVERFSLRYYYYMAISKYWVSNLRQPMRLRKREEQVMLETWHGTPLKRLGLDINTIYSFDPELKQQYIENSREWKYLLSPNHYTSEIYRSAFNYHGKILEYGYPRNDLLYNYTNEDIFKIKNELNLPKDKKIILYAPTWRDDEFYDKGSYKMSLKLDLDLLKNRLQNDYIILIRTHYFISDVLDLKEFNNFAWDVSKYDDISHLYIISDILITDYSSVFFDYGNLKRPILFYTYDLDKYESVLRGFYLDITKEIPGPLLFSSEEVVESIINIDDINQEFKDKYEKFYNKFCHLDDGNASERVSKTVFDL
ncbi:MAG: CDP-glycerol:glycerophosphate glycerophosphotransferase [Methanobrevibacter sp.]|jgi:CDP-glycerol glycerophosphotransferase|nr:CDP-glycerol:glycerophosphate glycerophosphotransferase [Candidatus Methanoflexus mossambicus]